MPDTVIETMAPAAPREVSRILADAADLIAAASYRDAIDAVTSANRALRSPELYRRLMQLRAEAFASIERSPPLWPWPVEYPDPFPDLIGLPEIDASELTVEIMGGAIQHHGALWVHGFVAAGEADDLRQGIERAFAARDAHYAGAAQDATDPWYAQNPLESRIVLGRRWMETAGGVWTADSPRMTSELIDFYYSKGLIDIIAQFMGEHPALSVGKSTLRRMPCAGPTFWHQDGAFLGPDTRTVNLWLALSDCGEDAPGLDIVGQRLDHIVPTGTHGAAFDWSVGEGMIESLEQDGVTVVSPVFKPGDALLFDQLMLHRTGVRVGMTKDRWAIENWFFAPSTFPMEQGPLMV